MRTWIAIFLGNSIVTKWGWGPSELGTTCSSVKLCNDTTMKHSLPECVGVVVLQTLRTETKLE